MKHICYNLFVSEGETENTLVSEGVIIKDYAFTPLFKIFKQRMETKNEDRNFENV